MIIDDLDRHFAATGDLAQAAALPGLYLAWCVNARLTDAAFDERLAGPVLKVRMRDDTGAALLVAAGGELRHDMLNDQGRAFAGFIYSSYCDEFARVMALTTSHASIIHSKRPAENAPPDGAERRPLPDKSAAIDDWDIYDQLAPWLTRGFMKWCGNPPAAANGGRWWQFWK